MINKNGITHWRVILNGEHAKTKFAPRASEVIFDSEVHLVSEVSPAAKLGVPRNEQSEFWGFPKWGKLNFTWVQAQTSLRSNFTFALAKTSQKVY